MKVRCILEQIREHEEMTVAELHAETRIDRRSLSKLLRDKGWGVSRKNYASLTKFAFDHGYQSVFRIEHDPLWETFGHKDARTLIYRGEPQWDTEIEKSLANFIVVLGGDPTMAPATTNVAAVRKAMREHNCIFVGSPKSNPSTEIALCQLFGAKSFDPDARANLPVQIVGVDPPGKRGSAVLRPSDDKHGFEITKGRKQFIDVHWLRKKEYDRWYGEGADAAIVVVCLSPLKTKEHVTTILIMGYNGLATQSAAQQLIHGGVPVTPSAGTTQMLAYEFQFRKSQLPTKRDPRREIRQPAGAWSVLFEQSPRS